MIDHRPDPGPDPLAGLDPHPREQIDYWPLHDARQELLEEIVSQSGPGQSPSRSKVLLSVVGIAAVLALIAGGAWAVTRDGTDGDADRDTQVAAASDESSPSPSEATTETTVDQAQEPREPRNRREVRVNGERVGAVRLLGKCPRSLVDRLSVNRMQQLRRLGRLERVLGDNEKCRVVVRLSTVKQRLGDGKPPRRP